MFCGNQCKVWDPGRTFWSHRFLIASTDVPLQDLDNNETTNGKLEEDSVESPHVKSLSSLENSKRDVNVTRTSYPVVLSWLASADLAGKNDDGFFKSTTITTNSRNANPSFSNNPTSTIVTSKSRKEESSITALAAPVLPKPEPLQSSSRHDENIRFQDESVRSNHHEDETIQFEELPPAIVGVKSRDQIRRDLSRLSARLRSNNNAAAVVTDADNTNANSKLMSRFSWKYSLSGTEWYGNPWFYPECDRLYLSGADGVYNGTFESPNLVPEDGHSLQCIYTFVARPNERVEIIFTHFNVRGTPPE